MNWTCLYENDSWGNPLQGRLSDLISAVSGGSELRYFIDYDKHGPGCYKRAKGIWIDEGHLHAQGEELISSCFSDSYHGLDSKVNSSKFSANGLRFIKAPYVYYQNVSTTGDVDMLRWGLEENRVVFRDQQKYALRWYVR